MEAVMARCETCGNDYDKAFQVTMNGTTHTFDSFECAIHALAPTCDNCGIHIVGHGLEKEGTFFCCEHCAEVKGVSGLRDRIGAGGVIELGSGRERLFWYRFSDGPPRCRSPETFVALARYDRKRLSESETRTPPSPSYELDAMVFGLLGFSRMHNFAQNAAFADLVGWIALIGARGGELLRYCQGDDRIPGFAAESAGAPSFSFLGLAGWRRKYRRPRLEYGSKRAL